MRTLAILTFSFSAGALLVVLGLPAPVLALAAVLAAGAALLTLLLGPRSRTVVLLALLAAAVGFSYGRAWEKENLSLPESLVGESRPCTVELAEYPHRTKYGWSAEARTSVQGRSFRVMTYFYGIDGADKLAPGSFLSGTGTFSKADDEGESFGYYRSIGIPIFVSLKDTSLLPENHSDALRYYPVRLSRQLKERTGEIFPGDVSGFLTALLTGDKSGLSYGEKTDLKIAGTYHTLAISGMHVSILMSVVYALSLRNRKLYPVFGVPVLVFYCLMTGMSSSVVRAAVMQFFLMMAPVFNRESDTPTAMGTSIFCQVLFNPWCLVNVGLLMSYGAVAGILLFASPLRDYLLKGRANFRGKSFAAQVRRFFAASAGTTLSAFAFTLPITLFCFGTVPLFSLLANLLTIWAVSACFILGFPAVLLSFVSRKLAAVLVFPVSWILRYIRLVVSAVASIPFAAIYPDQVILPLWCACSILFILLILWRRERLTGSLLLSLLSGWMILVAASGLYLCGRYSADRFTFTALDVGQGQCLLLESDGCTAVVDCGGSYGDEAGELLAEEILSRGYRGPDILVITHYDIDHTGGAEQLFHRLSVGALFLPDIPDDSGNRERLESLARSCDVPVFYPESRMVLSFGNGNLSILPPPKLDGGNESCLSLLAGFDGYDILVTGDLPSAQEKLLLEQYPMEKVELLVAGHHGARSSSSELLLHRLEPQLVVISVGENRYGHPSEETLQRIASVNALVFRTDLNGTITVRR